MGRTRATGRLMWAGSIAYAAKISSNERRSRSFATAALASNRLKPATIRIPMAGSSVMEHMLAQDGASEIVAHRRATVRTGGTIRHALVKPCTHCSNRARIGQTALASEFWAGV